MVEPLRHRQTKGAATDMFYLTPPRHISTLPFASFWQCMGYFRSTPNSGHGVAPQQLMRMGWTGRAPAPNRVTEQNDALKEANVDR